MILLFHITQLLSKNCRYNEKASEPRLRGRREEAVWSVIAVEGDAGEVFGAVDEVVEGDSQRGVAALIRMSKSSTTSLTS